MSNIRSGKSNEKPLQASKWIQIQMLIELDEMTSLFTALGNFEIYRCGCVLKKGEESVSREAFLDCYRTYLSFLKEGKIPPESLYTPIFSSVFTTTTDCLFALPVGDDRQIIRVSKPLVQLQAHQMGYSTSDGKFHSMTFGMDSIQWGIQFSYPQLVQNSETYDIEKVMEIPGSPNRDLFRQIQAWMRSHTIPTPFLVEDHKINVPMRIGKQCLSWINQHPQLRKKGIAVA